MVKFFCDRCGEEIISPKYGIFTHKVYYAQVQLLSSRAKWDKDEKWLCPQCEQEYIHWFLNPEKEQEVKL